MITDPHLEPQGAQPGRLFYLDNLRIMLISLVVLHHLAVIYAANVGFYYVEPTKDILAIVVLAYFQLLNQAYFMGLFFFLSGYLAPGALDRKGAGLFLKDRLIRLGAPLLVYIFVLNPVASIGVYQMPSELTGITGPFIWSEHFSDGPLWFVVMLIIFNAIYSLLRAASKNKPAKARAGGPQFPKTRVIILFVVCLAAASYLIRIVFPISHAWLNFPSLAYLPQYASFFALGALAYRGDWLRAIPEKFGRNGFIIAVASIILMLFSMSARYGSPSAFLGGGTLQSGTYALFDSIFSVALGLSLLVIFRRRYNHQNRFGKALQKSCFTVYVIHCPVIVMLAAFVLRGLELAPLLKFGLAAVISVPLCFALAYLIGKLPYVNKIIH